MPKGFSEFHYYGFLTKCAEHGLVDPKVVDAMYKLAARPPRMVRNAYTGERLGYENAQARPDLQAGAYSAAQAAVPGGGPPHLYRPLRPVKASPASSTATATKAPTAAAPAAAPAAPPAAAPAAPAPKPTPVAKPAVNPPAAAPAAKPPARPAATDEYRPRGTVWNIVQNGLDNY